MVCPVSNIVVLGNTWRTHWQKTVACGKLTSFIKHTPCSVTNTMRRRRSRWRNREKNVELVRLHFDEVQFEDNRHAKGCLRVIRLLFGGISEN
jgi:hypothetical protein